MFPSMCVLNNLRKSVHSYHSSQFAVAYSSVPRGILISLNQHGHTKTEPKFFTTSLIKRPYASWEVQANLATQNL